MNTKIKRLLNIIMVFFLVVTQLPQNVLISSAATNAKVYEYSVMLEDRGSIYYIQTVEGDKNIDNIYRIEITSGNKTKLISSKNGVAGVLV